jgi:hypothetical protein
VAPCEIDPSVALPYFRSRCVGDPTDSLAWIEVVAFPQDRFLGHSIARVLVSPSGTPGNTWRRVRHTSPEGTASSFEQSFASRVNEIRTRAKLAPLQLEAEQSRTAEKVAPHYFASTIGKTKDASTADLIALGMMAGWDVSGGAIRSGSFNSDVAYGTTDVSELVTQMLTYPSGRSSLLNPESRLLAVGQLPANESRSIAALASTYVLMEPKPLKEEQLLVLQEFNRQRAVLGLEPAVWMSGPKDLEQDSANSIGSGWSPDDVMNGMLSSVANIMGRTYGWTLGTSDLAHIKFPDKLLRAPKLPVLITVGHFKSPATPWATYAIIIITPESSQIGPTNNVMASIASDREAPL